MRLEEIQNSLESSGMIIRGAYDAGASFRVLVGNAGSRIWKFFKQSSEFADGRPDPLDRWSKRIGDALAEEAGAGVIYPFEGPPYPPFLDWAARGEQVTASPLSIYIHPEFGLWHAYRFSLELQTVPPDHVAEEGVASPCESCEEKPCLSACPVSAFEDGDFARHRCVDYLLDDKGSDCRTLGCAARRACPVGEKYQYQADHAQFHMHAFMASDL